jgi:hypothetical protein
MNENQSQQQNEKNHRKLVRSPENLSPCDFDSSHNPLLFSTSASSVPQSSPVKASHNEPPSKAREAWHHPQPHQQQHDQNSTSLPPSLSAPSIFRKPSISIKCSEEDIRDQISRASSSFSNKSSLTLHQLNSNSKSIDSSRIISVKQEQVDQASNNFLPKNNVVSPNRSSQPPPSQQQLHHHHHHHQSWFSDSSNYGSTKHDIYQQQQTEHHQQRDYGAVEFSMSASMDSNVISQTQHQTFAHTLIQAQPSSTVTRGQMIFNHNNPFLSDSFENNSTATTTTTSMDVNGKLDENFFNIDDSNESDLLFFMERSKSSFAEQSSSVRNKREKFSQNASTKICLVVSPPTNKFQVSFLSSCISRLNIVNFRCVFSMMKNVKKNERKSSSSYLGVTFPVEKAYINIIII